MIPYIRFNGVSSADLGLRLIETEPFILPARTRSREKIPGKIGSLASEQFDLPEMGYKLRLGMEGSGKDDVVSRLHEIAAWALSARIMTSWLTPDCYYTGAVEGDTSFEMLTKRHGQLEMSFICDPPCRHKAKTSAPWIPSLALPIPEQLTETINTAAVSGQAADFTMNAGETEGAFPPAVYLRLSGYWAELHIGHLNILEGSGSTTLYIDCEAQEVYKIVSGVRTPVKYSGQFPGLAGGSMDISGTGFNLSAKLLVIERG